MKVKWKLKRRNATVLVNPVKKKTTRNIRRTLMIKVSGNARHVITMR